MNELFTLIHIGKSGGTTVKGELKRHNIKFKECHVSKPIYNPHEKYLIVLRNPIQRFISAFNWRYFLLFDRKTQQERFLGEKELLEKYKSVDELATEMRKTKKLNKFKKIFNGSPKNKNYIHHLKEDINYYLNNIIYKCSPEQIIGIITTETLHSDMKKLFNIDVKYHSMSNPTYNTKKKITNETYNTLREYLHKDYEIIKYMYKNKFIDKEKFKILYA